VIRTLSLSADLGAPAVIAACALAALGVGLLAIELFRAHRPRGVSVRVALSGALAALGLLAAVLRPVSVVSTGTLVGPKVVVLADASRSIDLPGLDGTRRQSLERALAELQKRGNEVRLSLYSFGIGPAEPVAPLAVGVSPTFRVKPVLGSDLAAALESVARAADERPAAIVVLSDGRLDRPGEVAPGDATRAALGQLAIPVHTVGLAEAAPRDASIRRVLAAGAAVAHQPFSLRIEIGCAGGLSCGDIPVIARELRDQGQPVMLASGVAHVVEGKATVELSMTVERAGARILEISIQPPEGDEIPENNRRFVSIDVGRDRVRVLHVAGRPTYDVRALRMWLKSDASVDVVAFFILRTHDSQVQASSDELALIPFPVDELFTEQLPTFDAVVLQDFNAKPYGLDKHLKNLARYVKDGGGLIMVGGQGSFIGGHYADTALADVLPVELDKGRQASASDLAWFSPHLTEAGRSAPVLAPLRALLGDELPDMPGANILGDARPGATVLMTHPVRRTPNGNPMPILALGESGSGRTMALAIDGSHRLLFSDFAARDAGRAHGAFWDAMLGWLMRDPRFEPAVIDVKGGCIAGEDTTLVLRPLSGQKGEATLRVVRLGSGDVVRERRTSLDGSGKPVELAAGTLDAGGYSAVVEIGAGAGKGPTTRRDFACEKGGDEWADSRPDVARLQAIAAATGGKYVRAEAAGSLPLPPATQVAAERQVAPLLPAWAWAIGAAMLLGAHWVVRGLGGVVCGVRARVAAGASRPRFVEGLSAGGSPPAAPAPAGIAPAPATPAGVTAPAAPAAAPAGPAAAPAAPAAAAPATPTAAPAAAPPAATPATTPPAATPAATPTAAAPGLLGFADVLVAGRGGRLLRRRGELLLVARLGRRILGLRRRAPHAHQRSGDREGKHRCHVTRAHTARSSHGPTSRVTSNPHRSTARSAPGRSLDTCSPRRGSSTPLLGGR